ncbi:hypothetical protein CBL_07108 [Carabus blaptoides fortunei]
MRKIILCVLDCISSSPRAAHVSTQRKDLEWTGSNVLHHNRNISLINSVDKRYLSILQNGNQAATNSLGFLKGITGSKCNDAVIMFFNSSGSVYVECGRFCLATINPPPVIQHRLHTYDEVKHQKKWFGSSDIDKQTNARHRITVGSSPLIGEWMDGRVKERRDDELVSARGSSNGAQLTTTLSLRIAEVDGRI